MLLSVAFKVWPTNPLLVHEAAIDKLASFDFARRPGFAARRSGVKRSGAKLVPFTPNAQTVPLVDSVISFFPRLISWTHSSPNSEYSSRMLSVMYSSRFSFASS